MRRKPAALILGLLLTAATVTSAGASFPGGDGRIVYLRFTSRAITPRTIRPDGTGDRELFNAPSGAYSFSVSADGRKLAFSTGKVSRIAILDRSTGHVTRVISATALHAQFLSSAAFSPDSSKLVICSIHRRAPTERLFVVGAVELSDGAQQLVGVEIG